jgi:hypothetical protein
MMLLHWVGMVIRYDTVSVDAEILVSPGDVVYMQGAPLPGGIFSRVRAGPVIGLSAANETLHTRDVVDYAVITGLGARRPAWRWTTAGHNLSADDVLFSREPCKCIGECIRVEVPGIFGTLHGVLAVETMGCVPEHDAVAIDETPLSLLPEFHRALDAKCPRLMPGRIQIATLASSTIGAIAGIFNAAAHLRRARRGPRDF